MAKRCLSGCRCQLCCKEAAGSIEEVGVSLDRELAHRLGCQSVLAETRLATDLGGAATVPQTRKRRANMSRSHLTRRTRNLLNDTHISSQTQKKERLLFFFSLCFSLFFFILVIKALIWILAAISTVCEIEGSRSNVARVILDLFPVLIFHS